MRVGLGRGAKHRPQAHVVRSAGPGRARIPKIQGGETDDHPTSHEPPRLRERQVLRSDMHPVRITGHGDVDAVIDKEERARVPAAVSQHEREVIHRAPAHVLGAQLQ